ncbi:MULTISPECIES: hypothetical protein [Stenotrophomonas]|uniref:hypothetical protein n=1 Tax=Stenotrophomonas TaxID=40323 RepID=UPI000B77978C|nr:MULTISPECIES: hypothetical protein [Stenotrophomonas]
MSTKVDTYRIDPALRTVLVAADLGRRFECVSTKVDTYRIDQALRAVLVVADLGRRRGCVSTKVDTYRWVALRGITAQR